MAAANPIGGANNGPEDLMTLSIYLGRRYWRRPTLLAATTTAPRQCRRIWSWAPPSSPASTWSLFSSTGRISSRIRCSPITWWRFTPLPPQVVKGEGGIKLGRERGTGRRGTGAGRGHDKNGTGPGGDGSWGMRRRWWGQDGDGTWRDRTGRDRRRYILCGSDTWFFGHRCGWSLKTLTLTCILWPVSWFHESKLQYNTETFSLHSP